MTGEVSGRLAAIAQRFLELSFEAGVPITQLQLQKLVTLVESLAQHVWNRKAFPEPVRAWPQGPAVQELYGAYKQYGYDAITAVAPEKIEPLPESLDLAIREVWEVAGHLPAGGHWKLTHETGPYQAYWDLGKGTAIPGEALGRAWPDFVTYAQQLTAYRQPVNSPVVGRGQEGFRTQEALDDAVSRFRPSRLRSSA